ncbi:hypothetical protein MCOR15_011792, partial [Pyricularia oryzae]
MTENMPPGRQSNTERRRIRDDCRKRLADHIYDSLGLQVKPADVRLLPRGSDFYRWRVLPGNEEICSKIFSKSLSDHSVNALRLLREEVGKSFEAIGTSESPNLNSQ